MKNTNRSILHKDGVSYILPFILVTSCFALWGFANDITNPMVKAFSKIFRMSVTDGALVQVAFYGGYFAMAFPAAMFIRKYSYKAGILLGLGLYALAIIQENKRDLSFCGKSSFPIVHDLNLSEHFCKATHTALKAYTNGEVK